MGFGINTLLDVAPPNFVHNIVDKDDFEDCVEEFEAEKHEET